MNAPATLAPPAPRVAEPPAAAPPADRDAVLAASAPLDGWLTRDESETLLDLALHTPGEGAVVEIGSFAGKSLVCLAGGARLRGPGRVVSIDPHGGSSEHQPGAPAARDDYWNAGEGRLNTLPVLRRNLRAAGLAEHVEVVVSTSDAAAATWNEPIRVLFIDGNHNYAQVVRDLRAWTPWVCEGGAVALHDYDAAEWPGVSRAVDEWLAADADFEPVRIAGEMLVVRRRTRAERATAPPPPPDDALAGEWRQAVAGDADARGRWAVQEGGAWGWEDDGVAVHGSGGGGGTWAALAWQVLHPDALAALGGYAVEVTVRGSAAAAGLSLGPYRDFLVEMEPDAGPRRLRVEVHPAGLWSFGVDGRAQPRHWWDSALSGPGGVAGTLTLKALDAEHVHFSDLRVARVEPAPCRVSVLLTCNRFAQRLRVALRGWCAQGLPMGALEVLVANPRSPDGTHEHLAAAARSHPHLRIREIPVSQSLGTTKGAMINLAMDASEGEWIWLSDADCLFAPSAVDRALAWMRPDRLGFAERRYLSAEQTDALLAGAADPVADFAALLRRVGPRPPHREPWGYCQIVHRSVATRVRYCNRTRHYAHTDVRFATECADRGAAPARVPGLACLHLEHPFAWYGTRDYL
jgi:predicted O-methyltransferase YrrM